MDAKKSKNPTVILRIFKIYNEEVKRPTKGKKMKNEKKIVKNVKSNRKSGKKLKKSVKK